MKKLAMMYAVFIVGAFSLLPAYAVTVVGDASTAKTSHSVSSGEVGNRYLNGQLKGRYESGRLDTSVGEYQLGAGVKVDDRRPAAQWYTVPAEANVQLELKAKRLIQVIIY
jgi:hypothetical protein